ncbi:MAG: DUF1194 domain-containing protein, partial [Pseudomonadota bacterium]
MKAALALIVAASLYASAGAARAAECALALALALDISSSVNAREYEIQKGGLSAALRHPDVRSAILAEPGSVRITVYEWSGWQQQDVIADWAVMESEADIDALAFRLDRHSRRYAEFSTALGEALDFGAKLFSKVGATCARRVIDVSGDGVNNDGVSPASTLGDRLFRGITVNGLVIKGASPDPETHYRQEVIWGPGAFLMVARNGFDDYPDMILGKLLREIQPPLFVSGAGG